MIITVLTLPFLLAVPNKQNYKTRSEHDGFTNYGERFTFHFIYKINYI